MHPNHFISNRVKLSVLPWIESFNYLVKKETIFIFEEIMSCKKKKKLGQSSLNSHAFVGNLVSDSELIKQLTETFWIKINKSPIYS